jgi:hypothetical protein
MLSGISSKASARLVEGKWVRSLGHELARKLKKNSSGSKKEFITDNEIRKGMTTCFGFGNRRNILPGELSVV